MLVKIHEELHLSRIVAGVMNWGVWGADLSTTAVAKLIQQCVDIGVSSFDHADIYGNFTTEKLFGDALKASGVNRSKIQLITKCGIKMPCPQRPQYNIKSYSNSAEHIFESVDNSLKNLGTDYIDLLLLHRPSPLLNAQEVAQTFSELRKRGLVKQFGVSNYPAHKFELLQKEISLATNQIEASLVHLDPFYDGTLDSTMLHNIFPMAWSPLGGGQLFAESKEYEIVMRRGRFLDLSKKYDWKMDEMAYKFLLHHPARILPVTGSSKIERIQVAVDSMEGPISDEQWFEIWTASKGQDIA